VSNDLWMDGPDDIANAPMPKRWRSGRRAGNSAQHIGCPVWWLRCVLPAVKSKKQLVVALYLWRRRVICGDRGTFDVPNNELRGWGISRQTKYQTLALLVAAGKIRTRQKGKESLTVTILAREPSSKRRRQ
jgi:hypothetical protein